MSDQVVTKRAPREHAAAKADINIKLRDKFRELKAEKAELQKKIQELEVKAAQEQDEEKVIELLAERTKHAARIEAMPFFLRNAKVRALRAQADALEAEAQDVKIDLDEAQSQAEEVEARISELQRQLDEAKNSLPPLTMRRDELARNHQSLVKAYGAARGDARCVEEGREMIVVPNRFDGICDTEI